MSFFTDRSDLNGSSERQNAMSRHCRGSSESWNRWQSFSMMFSACFSYLANEQAQQLPWITTNLLDKGEYIFQDTLESLFVDSVLAC
jgi:hypothetical protein